MSDLSTNRIILKLPLDKLHPSPFQMTRDNARIQALAENIALVGLENPIIVIPDGEPDEYYILSGHCRVEAVKLLGWTTIDAQVWENDLEDVEQKKHALLAMLSDNTQRSSYTDMETAWLVQGMLDLGISEKDTASAANVLPAAIPWYRTAANIDNHYVESLERQLSIGEAAFLVEFSDEPEIITCATQLINEDGDLQRYMIARRRERAIAQLVAGEETLFEEQGITVIKKPGHDEKKIVPLKAIGISPENHRSCDGHAVYIDPAWDGSKTEAVFVCLDAKKHHKFAIPKPERSEHEQAAAEKAAAGREFKKEGLVDTEARRAFVKELLTKDSSQIKGAMPFFSYCIAHHIGTTGELAYELQGKKIPDHCYVQDFEARNAPLAFKAMLAMTCAAIDDDLRLAQEPHNYRTVHAPAYLGFLKLNGYKLGEHESLFLPDVD